MEEFWQKALLFIDRWNYVFYAVGTLGVLLYLLRAREAYRERRYTPFPIEREEATAVLRDSVFILFILLAILATTVYIDRVLLGSPTEADEAPIAVAESSATATAPVIGPSPTPEGTPSDATGEGEADTSEDPEDAASPTESSEPPSGEEGDGAPTAEGEGEPTAEGEEGPPAESEPSPTPSLPPTPEPTPTEGASPIPTQPPPPTATPEPTEPPPPPTAMPEPTEPPPPTNPPQPTAPPVPPARCNTPGVQISSPSNGQVVSGSVTIAGTANIDGFQFYKVEYAVNGTEGPYASIGDIVRTPVSGGALVTWNTGGFGSGVWNLRLTVVDQTGNFPAPCDIYVIIP